MSKLVVVFSYGGVTKKKGEKLAKDLGADFFEIKAKVPYTKEDVNWMDKSSRNVKEQKDPASRPEIAEMPSLEGVDEIWVGYPIWWYTHPRIINTFFDNIDLTGKKIHLFATSGGSGISGSVKELEQTYNVKIADAKML